MIDGERDKETYEVRRLLGKGSEGIGGSQDHGKAHKRREGLRDPLCRQDSLDDRELQSVGRCAKPWMLDEYICVCDVKKKEEERKKGGNEGG